MGTWMRTAGESQTSSNGAWRRQKHLAGVSCLCVLELPQQDQWDSMK